MVDRKMDLSMKAIQNRVLLAAKLDDVPICIFPELIETLRNAEWPQSVGPCPDCWEDMELEQRIIASAKLQAFLIYQCGPKMYYRYKMRAEMRDRQFEDWWSYHGEEKTRQEEALMKNYGYGVRL